MLNLKMVGSKAKTMNNNNNLEWKNLTGDKTMGKQIQVNRSVWIEKVYYKPTKQNKTTKSNKAKTIETDSGFAFQGNTMEQVLFFRYALVLSTYSPRNH